MENEIIISDSNSLDGYSAMPHEITLGFSADEELDILPAGVTIVGAGITVDNDFGQDVILDGTGVVDFPNSSEYVTVDASQTTYNMRVYGNDKNNIIRGGNGENTLSGGASGLNSLTGGSTRDYFMYNGVGRTVVTNFSAGKTNRSDVIFFVDDSTSSKVEAVRNGSTVRMKFGADTSNENYISLVGAGSADSIIQYATGNSTGVKYAKIGGSSLVYDDEVSYFKTTAGGTVKVNSENSVNIWMNGSHGQIFADVTVLDAGNSPGYNTLVGNTDATTSIIGGYGNSSLWGGYGVANDTLVGGNGSEMFWFGRYDGNDVVQNAASNDTVFLYDTILDHIQSFSAEASQVKLYFNTNSYIAVTSADTISPVFTLADKSRWTYNFNNGTWSQS